MGLAFREYVMLYVCIVVTEYYVLVVCVECEVDGCHRLLGFSCGIIRGKSIVFLERVTWELHWIMRQMLCWVFC